MLRGDRETGRKTGSLPVASPGVANSGEPQWPMKRRNVRCERPDQYGLVL
jgi:hypothetical protein